MDSTKSEVTAKINGLRLVGCGLLAGIVWIILGSVVTALLGRNFAAQPNNHLGAPTPGFVLFNAVIDLVEGMSILWLYAVLRLRHGPGAKTAVYAAFAWWFIVTLGDATWCSFGFFSAAHGHSVDDWNSAGASRRCNRWGTILQISEVAQSLCFSDSAASRQDRDSR